MDLSQQNGTFAVSWAVQLCFLFTFCRLGREDRMKWPEFTEKPARISRDYSFGHTNSDFQRLLGSLGSWVSLSHTEQHSPLREKAQPLLAHPRIWPCSSEKHWSTLYARTRVCPDSLHAWSPVPVGGCMWLGYAGMAGAEHGGAKGRAGGEKSLGSSMGILGVYFNMMLSAIYLSTRIVFVIVMFVKVWGSSVLFQ